MNENIKRCMKCVMPETSESLLIDNRDGVCSVCNQVTVEKKKIDWVKREKELNLLVSEYKNKHDYDCIVPFSGGKDSTFTLWYLVKKLNLKCLVVRFDHLFMRDVVEENAKKTFEILGVDVLRFSPNPKVVQKLMFESFKRRGDFCWHCHTGIFSYPIWVAINYKCPLIFWGEPGSEYSSFYSYDDEELSDEKRFNLKINLGINAEDMVGMLDDTVNDYKVTLRDLKPFTYPDRKLFVQNKIKSVFLGSYIPWNVKENYEIIKNELDWKGDEVEGIPPEYNYEKIECYLQGTRDYVKFLKRGFGRTTHLTSIDIRNKVIEREKALDLVDKYDGKKPASLQYFLKILNINEKEFMDIISKHVVAPNQIPDINDLISSNKMPDDFDKFKKISSNFSNLSNKK